MSNKKSLLNESTIRRFMKLASIAPLSETFLEKNKLDEKDLENPEKVEEDSEPEEPVNEEEDSKEEVAEGYGTMPGQRDDEMEMPPPEEAPELPGETDELEMDAEPTPPEGGEALAQDVAVAVADALESVLGVEVNVSGTEGEEEPMEEPGMEDELSPPEEEPVMEDEDGFDHDKVVAEVTRRVTERLKGKIRKEQMAEALADKIFKRLAEKKG